MERKGLALTVAVVLWGFAAFHLTALVVHVATGSVREARFFGRYLGEADLSSRWVPLALVGVFAWVVLQVGFRAARIVREEIATSRLRVSRDGIPRGLRAGRRAQLFSEHASAPRRLAEALPASSAIDAAALDNSYVLLKALVWSLPVLGFIGTASEMAHSINGFGEALTLSPSGGSAIAVVTDRMAQVVVPGLANAFSITMLALGGSILAHWWAVNLQSFDRSALERLDRTSVGLLTAQVPPSETSSMSETTARMLVQGLGALAREVEQLSAKLDMNEPGKRLEASAAALASSAGELQKAAGELSSATQGPYQISFTRGGRP